MGNVIYKSRNVGRCLTEYKREDYDEVVKKCTKFFQKSQFDKNHEGSLASDLFSYSEIHKMPMVPPKCHYGSILYGILDEENPKIIQLMSVIDSSD